MGTVLLPSDDIAIQAIMTVFLTGTAAVGLFTLSSSLLAYAALAGPVLVPPAVYMIAMGRVETLGLGEALLFFVLLVEDNAVNSEIALAMLGRMGVAADRAEDGLAALGAVEQTDFDLILMDCQMPNMDGFEATRRMIARERSLGLAHTPIVALTANAIRGDREACIAAGMDDYLAKPFLFDALRAALERWLPPR